MVKNTTYFFDGFMLDVSRKVLLRLPTKENVGLTLKAISVLELLVEHSGDLVTKEELMANVWSEKFVEESNLTQTISVLRKALGETPGQHRYIVTETGEGYRFVAKVSNSITDQTVSASESQPGSTEETRKEKIGFTGPISRRSLIISIALILPLLLLVGFIWFSSGTQNEIPNDSLNNNNMVNAVAVLPFKNIDKVATDKVLGIGMAGAVITKLSRIKGITVRQTSSIVRYAESASDAKKVGLEMGVDAVLEGTIQKANGRIRVFARLIRVSDGALVWAENFDEQEKEIFELQDSISERVAESLAVKLSNQDRVNLRIRHTKNLEAYERYNRGRFFWNNRSSDGLRKSIELYKEAIAMDSEYALAYAGLAESYVLLHTFSPQQEKDAFPNAKKAAQKALSLDPNLAEARAALALCREQYDWNWIEAEKEFKRAITANPGYATTRQWYGEFLAFLGRTDESIAEMEKAAQLDPMSLSTNTAKAFPYLASRQYDKAIEKLDAALELDQDFPLAQYYLGRSYAGKGQYEKAIVHYRKALKSSDSSYFVSALIYSLQKNGQKAEARKAFEKISKSSSEGTVSKYVVARSLAALGKKDLALKELENAYTERDSLMIVMLIDQNFDEIKNETRFKKILSDLDLDGQESD